MPKPCKSDYFTRFRQGPNNSIITRWWFRWFHHFHLPNIGGSLFFCMWKSVKVTNCAKLMYGILFITRDPETSKTRPWKINGRKMINFLLRRPIFRDELLFLGRVSLLFALNITPRLSPYAIYRYMSSVQNPRVKLYLLVGSSRSCLLLWSLKRGCWFPKNKTLGANLSHYAWLVLLSLQLKRQVMEPESQPGFKWMDPSMISNHFPFVKIWFIIRIVKQPFFSVSVHSWPLKTRYPNKPESQKEAKKRLSSWYLPGFQGCPSPQRFNFGGVKQMDDH